VPFYPQGGGPRKHYPVPSTGIATCTVPGPNCSFEAGALTTSLWPFYWAHRPNYPSVAYWGTPGSHFPADPYLDNVPVQLWPWVLGQPEAFLWKSTRLTNTCLWGMQPGRVDGQGGYYTEYQVVAYGQY
jgi:hypothetical protein